MTLVSTSLLTSASGQSVQVGRPITINSILKAEDLVAYKAKVPGSISQISDAVGLEARVTLYPGRPIMAGEIGPVAIIERNQAIQLLFARGTLEITADGRALGRAGMGDRVRVMNEDSKAIVSGIVIGFGQVQVGW